MGSCCSKGCATICGGSKVAPLTAPVYHKPLDEPYKDWECTDVEDGAIYVVGLDDLCCLLSTGNTLYYVDENGNFKEIFKAGINDKVCQVIKHKTTIFVIEQSGHIYKCELRDITKSRKTWETWEVEEAQALSVGVAFDGETLVLVDSPEAFTYNLPSQKKQTVRSNIKAKSMALKGTSSSAVYAITDIANNQIEFYDHQWNVKSTINSVDGEAFKSPRQCIFLPSGNLLLADCENNRVTEFTEGGGFIRHWLAQDELMPLSISFVHPYLWCVSASGSVARYKIY